MRQAGAYSKLLSGGRSGPHALPLARIKKIMKSSSEEVKMISGEAPIVFSKACELFIEENEAGVGDDAAGEEEDHAERRRRLRCYYN
ncbi:UNVERIFIED_CONTAM: Nuclear transcription factor Y subunit C-4 [Sesamum radiatum]|uniref:Nuclear transcription factor Y subunit C-4 n=1 Tax=Sesamum radiatum TaxID=300843 RepID=A0AAW2L211_SESRA